MSNKEFKVTGDPMDCLAEECAEVIKALMKIKRFGLEGHPGKPMKDGARVSNRDELLDEMQDCEDRLNEVRNILGASRDSRILSAMPSEEIKQLNCRWTKLQEIAKKIGKENIINIQRMYPDDDIYFIYYFERGIAG